MIYTRHYDIYRERYISFFIIIIRYFFFLPLQNPDIIIIIRRGSRVARKIFEIDLFGLLLYYIYITFSRYIVSAGHLYDDDVIAGCS